VFTMPSHKLPVVSGEQLIKALQKLRYTVVRQRGTHIRLKKVTESRGSFNNRSKSQRDRERDTERHIKSGE